MIAANEATCIYVLPQVFSEYKEAFPNIQLQVERSYGSRIVDAVLENQVDFGVTQLPVADKRLQVVRVFSDEIKLMTPAGHPLAQLATVQSKDLLPYQLLLPKSGTTRTRLNQWFDVLEPDLNVSMELDATEMIKRFVLAGLGLSFMAAPHFQEEVDSGKLAAVSLAPEPMMRSVGLIYRKDKALSKAALGFIQVILDHAQDEPPVARLAVRS